jgi:parallel beta-helix repeat protein
MGAIDDNAKLEAKNKNNYMKNFLILIILFAFWQAASSQTSVSGSISQNTTWSLSNSPYRVTGTVTVQSGITLTIQPGVVIKSQVSPLNSTIKVKGVILAQGTQSQPIVFTSKKDDDYGGDTDGIVATPNAEDWSSVVIESTSGGSSILENCLFRFGSYYDGALTIDGSSPSIKNCSFFKCKRGLDIINSGNPMLMNNIFDNCTEVPIAKDIVTQVSYENNTYTNTNKLNAIGLINNASNTAGANYALNKSNLGNIINIPYAPLGTLTIPQGNSLTIQPGVIIKSDVYQINSTFVIKGTLSAQGTTGEPIVFTSKKDDTYGGDTNNDGATVPAPGDWSNIVFDQSSGNSSILKYCIFRYGTYYDGILTIKGSSPNVENCTFFKCERGIYVIQGGNPVILNNTFESCVKTPVARDLSTQVSFENNYYISNGLNAIGLINNTSNTPGTNYLLSKANLGNITNAPYSPLNTITIPTGNTLTIQPGVIIKSDVYQINSTFVINGALIALGTPTEPIIFTSPKDDLYGGDTNSDGISTPNPSDWSNIVIEASSGSNSIIENCLFRFGAYFDGALTIKGSTPVIKQNEFFKCKVGVLLNNCNTQIKSSSFIQNIVGCSVINTTNNSPLIDSSLFCHNSQVGIRIASGTVNISQSSFWDNSNFDIENLGTSNIEATSNWWHYNNYLAILNNPSSNFPNIFDKSDNLAKGVVDISNPKKPLTDFEFNLSGFNVYFNNTTPQVSDFLWNFGDNNQSSQVNPAHKYASAGYYDVCIEPANCDKNTRGSLCKTVLVKGLNSLYPNKIGNNNPYIAFVSGAGFKPNDIVKISRAGSNDIIADTIIYIDSTLIKVFFTLNNVQIGKWNLEVNGDLLNDILPEALNIEQSKPVSISVSIEGRNRIRTNRAIKLKIGIRNNSNQAVFGVPVYITLNSKFEAKVLNQVTPDSIPIDVLAQFRNGLYPVEKENQPGDSLLIGIFIVPMINSYETSYIELEVKTDAVLNDTISVRAGSPWLDYETLKAKGVLYRDDDENSCFECALAAAGYIPGLGCITSVISLISDGIELANAFNSPTSQNDFEAFETSVTAYNFTLGAALLPLSCLAGPAVSGSIAELIEKLAKVPSDVDGLKNCYKCGQGSGASLPVETGNSFDPNDKVGQYGYNEQHFINGKDELRYTIYFENVDSATAPASEVFITDNIDTSTLQLETIKFTGFGFGDKQYRFVIPVSDTSFTYDINLNPDKNTILRVNGKVDYSKNQVNWSFRSFDPMTMDLIEDIDLGFLSPNVISPEGEGFVTFTIEPKLNLPHLTEIKNGASIVFDNNLPIITPIWKNTVDNFKPESKVLSLSTAQSDTSFNVTWTGNDTESGISLYDIFYSVDGNPYELWRSGNSVNIDAVFTGINGKSYCFYSVAHDFVGNIEDIPTQPDACTQVIVNTNEPNNIGYKLLQNIPNPFSDETFIGFVLPEESDVKLTVTNQLGQIQTILEGKVNQGFHQIPYRAINTYTSIYFYTLITPKYTKTLKMIKH